MIVNNTGEGWEIVYQKAHGLLAAALAQHWRIEDRPERWIETLIAISDHDDNQQYWHARHHLTKQGTPQDFVLQPPDLKQARQVIEASRFKSAWITLLISEHFHNLYHDYSAEDKNLDQFLSEQADLRRRLLKEMKVGEKKLKLAYKLMYWCDRTSLILCKNQIPPDEKILEIAEGPDSASYHIKQAADNSIQIVPWPFEVESFEVAVETRLLNSVIFEDDNHLKSELENSPIIEKSWFFKRN